MSLKASALKENDIQKKTLLKEVKSILAHIDERIKISFDSGSRETVPVSVPIHFDIPYMANKDAQREIYYLVIKDLKKREFNVKIKLNEINTIFYVSWNTEDDKKVIEYKNTILAEHTII
jgi:hypothetical protein